MDLGIVCRLEQTGNEDSTLLLVLVAKVLAVADLFLPGPAPHLKTTNKSEEQDAPAQLANQVDTHPSQDLKHIVGAGDPAEAKAGGNTTLGSTRTTEITQNQVRVEVRHLTEDEQCNAGVYENGVVLRRGSRRVGAEYPVRDVEASEGPVVGAVLEDVAGGHGGVAEAVHEEGLILALQEVQGQEEADEELQVGGLGEGLVEVEVDQVAEGEEEEGWD